jgi:prophage maintenance system killer protein
MSNDVGDRIDKNTTEIIIFHSGDGDVKLNADFHDDTIWATQAQMAEIYSIDRTRVTRHVAKILADEELEEKSNVRKTHIPNSDKPIALYSLDMILAVGFRANATKQVVSFRRWAYEVLKKHLIDGFTINQQRLEHLNKTIEILSRSGDELISGIAEVLDTFADGLDLLDDYDHQSLAKPKGKSNDWILKYEEARNFIDSMKFGKESDLFGNEKDKSFHGSLGAIYQTFEGTELYPSIQEKAANLLYMIVKNHSFTDGNKRIAAALFVYFLEKNAALVNEAGEPIISGNTLAAITLMIALSKPEEKEIMCVLVMNMLDAGEGK